MSNSNLSLNCFINRAELVFALPLPEILRSLLHYCEYEIRKDFGILGESQRKNKKEHRKYVSGEFLEAFKSMEKEERINYYILITDFVFKLVNGRNEILVQKEDNFRFQGYIKSQKSKIWYRKALKHDNINHVLEIINEKSAKRTLINLAYYLIRKSKNSSYHAFVLEACDKRANKEWRNFHIGFQYSEDFEYIYEKLKKSVDCRQCKYIEAMYKGDAICKSSLNSIRRQSFCSEVDQNRKKDQTQENQYVTCYNFDDFDEDKQNLGRLSNNVKGQKIKKAYLKQIDQNIKPICQNDEKINNKSKKFHKNEWTYNQNSKQNSILIERAFNRFNPFLKQHTSFKFFDEQHIKIDKNGNIFVSNEYSKFKYSLETLQKGQHQQISGQCNQKMLSKQWKRDEKGALEYLNQEKISAQKGVIKFILGQMGRNFLSGKSILNISLPVDIFSTESHIQRLLHSLRMAPLLLQRVAQEININWEIATQKLTEVLALSATFGLSVSLLYLSQQKSFNPILGETSQMWIDGCPAYAQQISHHPPISSLYFVGRGFKIYGSLQTKIELGLNIGKGSNFGEVTIQFENGLKILNWFPEGEVSGLSYGKRKFNVTGKSYHFVENKELYLQIDYQSKNNQNEGLLGKFFTTNLKQIQHFRRHRKFANKNPKVHQLLSSDMKVSGIWSQQIKLNESLLINFDNQVVPNMDRQQFSLPSDSVWREDIMYKKVNNLQKSQQHKIILQQHQRQDRKLRSTKPK